MTLPFLESPVEQARRVVALTVTAWRVPTPSPRALARRAPYGHVPLRVARRARADAVHSPLSAPALAHSW
jgi:hypothetical protein